MKYRKWKAGTSKKVARGTKKVKRSATRGATTTGRATKTGAKKVGGYAKAKAKSYAQKKKAEAREQKETRQLIRTKEKYNCSQAAAEIIAGSGKSPQWWYARGYITKGTKGQWVVTDKGKEGLRRRG